MLQKARTTDMERLLSERKAATAAVCMILTTGLLDQFQATAPPNEEETPYP